MFIAGRHRSQILCSSGALCGNLSESRIRTDSSEILSDLPRPQRFHHNCTLFLHEPFVYLLYGFIVRLIRCVDGMLGVRYGSG